jgi:hypothetical protein
MTFAGDYWDCVLPLKITITGPSTGYETPEDNSKAVQKFRTRDRVVMLEIRDVVTEPGLAVVKRDDFDNNHLSLKVGTEVYALAEWEYLYYHAWIDGHEIEGGLPLADDTYFELSRPPKVEHWILLQKSRIKGIKSWVKYDDAVRDDHAIKTCKNYQHH